MTKMKMKLIPLLVLGSSLVAVPLAHAQKPKVAVFSGPTATIQNSQSLVTSNQARAKYGLPLLTNSDGTPIRFDVVRSQRLAAPVTAYIEAFSGHPLERDMRELYAPPDGYLSAETGAFSPERHRPDDVPVYEVTLRPDDGLYLLPYMARQADGSAWDGPCAFPGASADECRVTFYPDASRIVEEIDRFGLGNEVGKQPLERAGRLRFLPSRAVGRLSQGAAGR